MVYELRCVQCGAALELPPDLQAVYIDCPYCGRDNVLPQDIINHRYHQHVAKQHADYQQQQSAQHAAQHAALLAARRKRTRNLVIILAALAGIPIVGFGGCVALGFHLQAEEEKVEARARDPKINGLPRVSALMTELRAKQCEHIVIQPKHYRVSPAALSVNMKKLGNCTHVVAASGVAGNQLTLTIKGPGSSPASPPPPAGELNFRYCASDAGDTEFSISASLNEPFAAAVVDCPRTVAEGALRSKLEDSVTTGKQRTAVWTKELLAKGCKHIVSKPEVVQEDRSWDVTSVKGGQCYNFLAVSHFADVKLQAALEDPLGESLPVPEPAQEIRIIYCPKLDGKYKLRIKPSTNDHYTVAAVDCLRRSPEGLARERELLATKKP